MNTDSQCLVTENHHAPQAIVTSAHPPMTLEGFRPRVGDVSPRADREDDQD
jgi:hypothetical protein